ncbi:CBS-domain-containing membrane protein [Pseudomonas aeruginosa]|nr:CBS-domain-containing membrane protein [Pseudomonas aeruginosa]
MNDSPSTAVRTWLKGFRPLTLNARPRDCLRAGLGACIGALAAVFACQALFGSELALRLAAPLGASAVLLFALASSPLAQPWSMLGGNLVAALAGGLSAYWFGHDLAPALVGMALGMLLMFALRCLHPPSCALALSVALNPSLSELGIDVVWPILLSTLVLIGCALLYNNLMRSPYPRPYQSPRANLHGTRDLAPSARTDFSARDLDQALQDFGEYVDITRDDLERTDPPYRALRLASAHGRADRGTDHVPRRADRQHRDLHRRRLEAVAGTPSEGPAGARRASAAGRHRHPRATCSSTSAPTAARSSACASCAGPS